ncbi:Integumentary mucin B.1 [Frankliniella fusca]|uniref:Integumentary mucin B.1 n=1 Tax=Frankliniella fusca TaxID=407009 RepID=A0AAE1HYN2_9NEOP|nr:Integumentary mucin B.1 [Frankliniella fusca]
MNCYQGTAACTSAWDNIDRATPCEGTRHVGDRMAKIRARTWGKKRGVSHQKQLVWRLRETNFALQLKGWRENIENFCGSKPPEGGCGSRQAQGFNPLWQPTASVFHGNRRFADCDPIAQFDRFDPRTTIGLPLERSRRATARSSPEQHAVQLQPSSSPAPTQLQPSSSPAPTQLQPSSSPAPAQLQPSSSPVPAQLQPSSSPAPAQLQPSSSPTPAQLQPSSSPAPAQLQPSSSPAPAQLQSSSSPAPAHSTAAQQSAAQVPTGVDEETKSAWEHFINNGNRTTHFKCGSKGVRLCEDHFEPDLIGKLRLVKFAKPTIYPEYTPASAFKENLIPAEENSPYLEHLNDFRMPVTEWASKQEALMENVVVPLEGEGETIIGDSDFIDCDEQPLLDEATGLLYDPTDMPMLGDVQSFDPQATSSFGHDPVQKQSTVSDPVVEVMETKDPESGCSLHTSNMENISNCETPRIDRKRKIDKGPVQSGKRRAYVNDLTLNAFKSPRSAKRSMDLVKRRFNSMQARAKVVGQRLRRAVKKIRTLTDLLDHLKQEGHVDQQFSRIIEVTTSRVRRYWLKEDCKV